MRQPLTIRLLAISALAGSAAWFAPAECAGAAEAPAQIDAGYRADVTNLKTTVSYSAADDRTDLSLALVPPAPAGGSGVTLIFRARFRGRSVDGAQLDELVVRAHYALHSDDRRRTVGALTTDQSLRVNIDPQDPTGIELDFFPATWGYFGFSAPGDEIPVAFFVLTPADLRAMALARVITGDVLWTRFALTAEQIVALRSFARELLPPALPTTSDGRVEQ